MIISLFHPVVGGTEKQAERLAKKLREQGISISILTREVKGNPGLEEIEGITVFRKIKTVEFGVFWGITYIYSTLIFLIRFRKNYDLIHCHHMQGFHSFVATLLKGVLNKRVIIKVAGGGERGDISAIKERKFGGLYLRFMRRADKIISVSKEITSQLRENGFPPSLICEIPNGVDTREFSLHEGPMPNQERRIIYVGRFDQAKALDDLFKAFKKVYARFDQARLILVGDGEEKEHLIRLAHELGISPCVRFEGIQKDVKSYLGQSDIFVFPSLSEGMSNVLLEAMACGLPVIATRIGGNVDLIEDGLNGLLVSPQNPGELADAILFLLANPERSRQMGKEGRKRVEERYSLDRIARDYITLYQQLAFSKQEQAVS